MLKLSEELLNERHPLSRFSKLQPFCNLGSGIGRLRFLYFVFADAFIVMQNEYSDILKEHSIKSTDRAGFINGKNHVPKDRGKKQGKPGAKASRCIVIDR